ncbi:TRAP transporter small permease subunit [Kaustia mangrovi]|uniref:TRAP transporter small permease protein n=1 Tax=Kaustia mangrovi TaxID=2593653 RepID=A0A7S8HBQ2_9HYPH|nr:TRAP transporter small permease [Kaustia mangrovi]QPC42704.1 TRAP transporter small permease subunit [Kaustia mangrovi]
MLDRFRTGLERVLAIVSIGLMAALAILVVAAVISRKLGSSFTWYDEVASVMLAWITYYGAALAALKRAHLGFPNLVATLPPGLRLPLVLLAEGLVIFFFVMVTWSGYQVVEILRGDTLTSLPWVPVRFTQSVIPIGGALFIVAELLTVPERLSEARHGAPAADPDRVLEGVEK